LTDYAIGETDNAMDTAKPVTEKKGRGRPKLGNVLFARRVPPSKIPALLKALKEDVAPKTDQVVALLEDVDRLTKEVAELKDRLERCARATDDQKAIYWKDRALKAEATHASRSEFDQT
jgi:ABC-type transporter Mla subunit MlaD